MEVIEAGFGIINISTVTQRVENTESRCHVFRCRHDPAPGIVGVGNDRRTGGVQDRDHITLKVGDIVVIRAVVNHGQRRAGGVVGKVQGIAAHGHLAELTTVVDVVVGCRAVGSGGAHTIGIVGKRPGGAAGRHTRQFTAMLPGIRPGAAPGSRGLQGLNDYRTVRLPQPQWNKPYQLLNVYC